MLLAKFFFLLRLVEKELWADAIFVIAAHVFFQSRIFRGMADPIMLHIWNHTHPAVHMKSLSLFLAEQQRHPLYKSRSQNPLQVGFEIIFIDFKLVKDFNSNRFQSNHLPGLLLWTVGELHNFLPTLGQAHCLVIC